MVFYSNNDLILVVLISSKAYTLEYVIRKIAKGKGSPRI